MKRHYTELLFEYLRLFPCVALIGARQTGKTTLLKELPSGWKRYDLEKESDYRVISHDPGLFLRLNPERVAFDEIQLLPELFAALRVAIDAERDKPGRFVITGSSSPDLLKTVSESLAGRIAIIEIAPFSLAEAYALPPSRFYDLIARRAPVAALAGELDARVEIDKVHRFWLNGGYPEPWVKNSARFRAVWTENYIRTYLNRDVLRLFPGLQERKFRTFLQVLSNVSGSIVNYANVAGTLGISAPTVREYFQIAHGTYLWRHLPPYAKNPLKRIVRHPKGYLRDSGLLHFLLHLPSRHDLLAHPARGASWEGMAIENILRGFNARGIPHDCYYYRTGAGAEVDLVLEGDFGLLPIEIKYGQTVSPRELRAIRDFVQERKCRFGIVVNNDERPRLYEEKLVGIPLSAL